MNDEEKKADKRQGLYTAYGLLIGSGIGLVFGQAIFDNAGIGIVFGAGIGLALGAAFGSNPVKKNDNNDSTK